MKISDFLSPDQVMIDVRATDKVRLLKQLSTEAAAATGLPADQVVREIAKREELARPALATAWRCLTHGCKTSRRPSHFLPVSVTASTSTPSTANRWTSLCCCCSQRQAMVSKLNALACIARELRNQEVLRRLRALALIARLCLEQLPIPAWSRETGSARLLLALTGQCGLLRPQPYCLDSVVVHSSVSLGSTWTPCN